ncbi:MAG: ATPase AAA [Clostridiaceae bacterium BRH_c20a]|nr:MAG: ATPase AAA [Clostridiaceae bacterium BRH_c20a]KJS21156.1 MAG: ATPase AAA [Clostridiaceae bacterium BRH_c20a]
MDIFSTLKDEHLKKVSPLADRMRPKTLDELEGQEHLLAPGKLLRRAIESDRLSSIIFHGPPGSGKTTIASVIASVTKGHFTKINAVTAGVQDIRKLIVEAEERLGMYQKTTIVFVDEIHRFNKAQQDVLLPVVESGVIILIGATTENPYFSINSALLSRSLIFGLTPLSEKNIRILIKRSIEDKEKGLGNYKIEVSEEALEHLAHYAQGDARIALNGLELAVLSTQPDHKGIRKINLETVEESIQRPAVLYDKTGDQHYDVISAFIKSMRGSDPHATLHYLARMLDAGEDPRFIARRIVIHAAEDIGLADPQALIIAQNAAQALNFIGLPEGRLVLAQAALYIAVAPKSNSVLRGIDEALNDVKKGVIGPVPQHLRDSHYKGAHMLGHGKGYLYPHDYPGHYVEQQYLPDGLSDKKYYVPSGEGREQELYKNNLFKYDKKTE